MSGSRDHVRGRVRAVPASGTACALAIALSGPSAGCGGDSQARPPDIAGDAGASDCPNDLPSSMGCASELPSYDREVATIIEQRCATCHYPGNTQSGNVFADYEDVYSKRQTLLTRIYACVMPPENAPALSPDERRALLQWFVCGAPQN